MRLIHLADYGGAYPGSFIPMVRAVLDGGRRRGWEVQAVFTDVARERAWLQELREEGLACRTVPSGRAAVARTVDELAASDEETILHTHFTAFDLAAARAARRHRHVLAYWHLHSALRAGPWWWVRNAAKLRLLSRGVEEMLCVAPNILEQARARLAPAERLALVPNAIDLTRFPLASDEDRRTARRALDLPADATVILHFGWDWRRKGGDVFLEAIAALPQRAGSGAGELIAVTVADEQPARGLAGSLGIAERVRILAPSDNVAQLYAAADVFAAPSRGEGHPFAVAEALACGVPVVASPIPGHEMIASETERCRIAALEPSAIADAIAGWIARPAAEHERERVAAREWVVRELDILAWSERMLARYERTLSARGEGAR